MSLSVSANLYSLVGLQGPLPSRVPPVERRTAEQANLPTTTEDSQNFQNSGTRLKSETSEELENGGIRRTQLFEREDGRTFTRVEDFALTERGSRRTVFQQNPSGSLTQYEEVLDREPSGNFRRTQRFTDESGETSTQITSGYQVTDAFVLTGGNARRSEPVPFTPSRGTQLDLSV